MFQMSVPVTSPRADGDARTWSSEPDCPSYEYEYLPVPVSSGSKPNERSFSIGSSFV